MIIYNKLKAVLNGNINFYIERKRLDNLETNNEEQGVCGLDKPQYTNVTKFTNHERLRSMVNIGGF